MSQILGSTTSGGTITFVTGAGNAVPLLGTLNMVDGANITMSGAGANLTVGLSGTTNHALQVGNVGGSLTSLAVGGTGVILQGVTGADPTWSTATYPSTVTKGDVLVASANNVISVVNDVVNAGYALMTNVGGAPSFQALPAGVTYASDAETIAGTVTNKAVAPSNLKAKLGTQTIHALPIGASDSAALGWLAVGLNGETLMGSTGADCGWTSSPQFGGSVTALYDVTSTAGDIVSIGGSLISRDATNTATGPDLLFEKVRVAGAITSGDELGLARFMGYDGTQYISGAKITSTNSGTVAATRIAGDLKFYTHPDSAIALPSEPLLRMTINPNGTLVLADAYSTAGTPSGTAKVTLVDSNGLLYGLAGTAGQVLQGGTAPAFSTATYPSTVALGDVLVASAANVIGVVNDVTNAGYVLTANAGAAPTFQAVPTYTLPADVPETFATDSGSATPAVHSITIAGGSNIGTTGAGSTVTIDLDSSPSVSGSLTAGTYITATAGDLTLTDGDAIISNRDAGTTSPIAYFQKNRSGAALTTGDLTGTLKFSGYDGTQYTDSARITSTSSGTIASTRVAGNLQFYTHPDSAAANPTLRMTIASTGAITVATPDSGVGLTVSGGGITCSSGAIAASSGAVSASTTVTAGTNLIATSGNLNFTNFSYSTGGIQYNSNQLLSFYSNNTTPDYANILIGYQAGKNGMTFPNICLGFHSGNSLTTGGSDNFFAGMNTARYVTSGKCNIIIGSQEVGNGVSTGGHNIAITSWFGFKQCNGSGNLILGTSNTAYSGSYYYGAGYNLTTTDSSNILLNSIGTAGLNNTLKIGDGTGTGFAQLNAAYICGIYGVTPGGTKNIALIDSNNQLGSVATLPASMGGALAWTNTSAATVSMAVGNAYIFNYGSTTVATLPNVSFNYGDTIKIISHSVSGFTINQNAGQQLKIQTSGALTTSGASGHVYCTNNQTMLTLIAISSTIMYIYIEAGSVTVA